MNKLQNLESFEILNASELEVLSGGFTAESTVESTSGDRESNKKDLVEEVEA